MIAIENRLRHGLNKEDLCESKMEGTEAGTRKSSLRLYVGEEGGVATEKGGGQRQQ